MTPLIFVEHQDFSIGLNTVIDRSLITRVSYGAAYLRRGRPSQRMRLQSWDRGVNYRGQGNVTKNDVKSFAYTQGRMHDGDLKKWGGCR